MKNIYALGDVAGKKLLTPGEMSVCVCAGFHTEGGGGDALGFPPPQNFRIVL